MPQATSLNSIGLVAYLSGRSDDIHSTLNTVGQWSPHHTIGQMNPDRPDLIPSHMSVTSNNTPSKRHEHKVLSDKAAECEKRDDVRTVPVYRLRRRASHYGTAPPAAPVRVVGSVHAALVAVHPEPTRVRLVPVVDLGDGYHANLVPLKTKNRTKRVN